MLTNRQCLSPEVALSGPIENLFDIGWILAQWLREILSIKE